ncbi:MAG: flavodoxin [Clostridiales bacterium]|nr:flavodoxin [Clostridiales bacterium]
MKKRIAAWIITTIFALTVAGCSQDNSSGQAADSSNTQEETDGANAQEAPEDTGDTASSDTGTAQEGQSESSNVLIAYFSVPEDVDTEGIDANAGASIVVRDGQVMGNLEYMANVIQQTIGGDLFRIETVEEYPLDHEPLVDQAAEEQDEEARPELSIQIENPDQYDTILLGYPNWWGDMPMALYTFLEEYDFSGKTIIPFTAHGGSGFSDTVDTIAELQPDAEVSEEGLSISRNDVADAQEEISSWAQGLER